MGSLPHKTIRSSFSLTSNRVSCAGGMPCEAQWPHIRDAPAAQPSHEFGVKSMWVEPIMSQKRTQSLKK